VLSSLEEIFSERPDTVLSSLEEIVSETAATTLSSTLATRASFPEQEAKP